MADVKKVTIKELAESLTKLCEMYPELADRYACIPTDDGYSYGCPISPVGVYVDDDYDEPVAYIMSDDDRMSISTRDDMRTTVYTLEGKLHTPAPYICKDCMYMRCVDFYHKDYVCGAYVRKSSDVFPIAEACEKFRKK